MVEVTQRLDYARISRVEVVRIDPRWTDEKGRIWNEGDAYTLPDGWSWELLGIERSRWGIPAGCVPIIHSGRAHGWGTFCPGDVAIQRRQRRAS